MLLALLSLLLAYVVLWPAVNRPDRADAVVVLSGDHGERLHLALRLIEDGVTGTLVMAGEPDSARVIELCTVDQPFEVVCLRPQPDSTSAEARATAQLVDERGWERIVVATTTYHVARARLIFGRCLGKRPQMVAADAPYGGLKAMRSVAHEALGLVHAVSLQRRC